MFGSRYAILLIEEARKDGRELSTREAAKMAGVSHVAVLKMMKNRRLSETSEQFRKNSMIYIRDAISMANDIPCPKCESRRGYDISIVGDKVSFRCKACLARSTEKDMLRSGNMLPLQEEEPD